jgi:hypothetical protein
MSTAFAQFSPAYFTATAATRNGSCLAPFFAGSNRTSNCPGAAVGAHRDAKQPVRIVDVDVEAAIAAEADAVEVVAFGMTNWNRSCSECIIPLDAELLAFP